MERDLEHEREVPRLVETSRDSEILALAMMIHSFPLKEADAILVLPGLGESWRIEEAIWHWQNTYHVPHRFLLIAGNNPMEKLHEDLTLERLQEPPYNLGAIDNVFSAVSAENTLEQMHWAIDMVGKLGITSLTLYTSPYHLLRAYCTLIKTFQKRGVSPMIPIFPRVVTIPPKVGIPEYGHSGWEMVPGELERLRHYQAKGDVATFEEVKEYIDWLWETVR